jgi:hypothetical protein
VLEAQIEDELLGMLHRDGSNFCYEGKVAFEDREIKLSLTPADRFDSKRADISLPINRARTVVLALQQYAVMATDHATRELLPAANDEWLADGDETISEDDFRRSLVLAEIMFDENGGVTFWIDEAGDRFGGHFVEVRLDGADQFVSADLLG